MTILQISILAVVALILGRLPKFRQLALLAVSAFVVFWLQPAEPFVSFAFWLPVATLTITVLAWALTSTPEMRAWKQNWPAITILMGIVLLMDLNRYFNLTQVYISTTPPVILTLIVLIVVSAAALLLTQWQKSHRILQVMALIAIILIFVFLKVPQLTNYVLAFLSVAHGQNPDTVDVVFSWLGFSYLAFRLMHTIRDRQSGRLPAVTLAEYVNYVIFFPSFTAGPIDRLEQFVKELRTPLPMGDEDWIDAGRDCSSVSLKNLSWLIYWPSSPSAMCLFRKSKARAGCGSSFMPILSESILISADTPTLRSGWDDYSASVCPKISRPLILNRT